ncbi:MAG: cytochrome c oxidase assembly protein [Chloroflexi bacterium]|nr:cytochrome c oxidase assembly protein [Chloroflexota bacterium]
MPLLHIAGYEWLDWDANLDVVALCVLLQAAYLYAVTYLRSQPSDAGRADAGRVTRSQMALFTLGVLTIYAATGSPLHGLAENYLLTAHMLQHLLLTLVAAPLLLAGVPGWLWRAMLRTPGAMPVARVITQPVVAFAVFNASLLLFHLPPTIDLQLRVHGFHLFVHFALTASGLLMWWPILSPLKELPRLSEPLQIGYLFLQSLLPAVMASFITFSESAVYSFYAEAPRIWNLTAVDDQQIAGGLMKLMGAIILWSYMTVVFFRWYARVEAEEKEPDGDDVEAEPRELGLESR